MTFFLLMERCVIVGCGIPKQIWSAIKKWAKEKWNERVVGQANNQALTIEPT
jgi:SET domain-containing protein